MQIYKAPSILIFHLKRFKASSHRSFKSKLDTLVEFPLTGLDMTDQILNTNIPNEYNNEALLENGEDSIYYNLYYKE